jgi:hypothetical protein
MLKNIFFNSLDVKYSIYALISFSILLIGWWLCMFIFGSKLNLLNEGFPFLIFKIFRSSMERLHFMGFIIVNKKYIPIDQLGSCENGETNFTHVY